MTQTRLTSKKTHEEIIKMIEALGRQRAALPENNMFGDPNHKIIDYQIQVLKGKLSEEDILRLPENDEDINEEHAFEIAVALSWLNDGDADTSLVDEEHLR